MATDTYKDIISGNTPGGQSMFEGGGRTAAPTDFGGLTQPSSRPEPTAQPESGTGGNTPAVSEPTIGETLAGIRNQALGIQEILNQRQAEESRTFMAPPAEEGPTYNDIYGDENDDEATRNSVLDLFRGEIDATNQVYDQLLNEARLEGQGRLGSQRASAARGGLLGSDFAGSQKAKVQDFNTDIRRGIRAERMAKIGSILGTARREAASEIAAKRAARQQDAENYISFLANKQERAQRRVNNVAEAMAAQGFNPSEMSEDELQSIADEAGTSPAELITAYSLLESEEGDQFTLGKGDRRFDAQGNLIAEGGGDDGTIFSTSSGLVQVKDGNANLIYGTGGGSGSSSGGGSFTPTQRNKLEAAGLLNAPRQQQLEYLFSPDQGGGTESFDTARKFIEDNSDATDAELKAALLERSNELGLGVSDINSLLASREKQFPVFSDKLATQIIDKLYGADGFDMDYDQVVKVIDEGKITANGTTYTLTPEQQNILLATLDKQQGFFQGLFEGGK